MPGMWAPMLAQAMGQGGIPSPPLSIDQILPGGGMLTPPTPPGPGQLLDFAQGIPGVPNAPSPSQLTDFLPGANSLPGVQGFSSLLGNMLGFGSNNPSYEDLFGPGGSISSQMRQMAPGTVNPFENLSGLISQNIPGSNLYG